jgi:hypothetical protein
MSLSYTTRRRRGGVRGSGGAVRGAGGEHGLRAALPAEGHGEAVRAAGRRVPPRVGPAAPAAAAATGASRVCGCGAGWVAREPASHSGAKVANRRDGFGWEIAHEAVSRRAADFPRHGGTPYRGPHVRRWGLRFVHRSTASFCRAVPIPSFMIRNFLHRCTSRPRA